MTAALAATTQMGWHNAFGDGSALVTTGWFKLCRHPVYALSFVFMVGWGLMASQLAIIAILGLWALIYALATWAKEPWIAKRFGAEYQAYQACTPRFLPDFKFK